MIIDNKLHHWITKRNYAPYGEGLSKDIDGMFTLTAGGGYLFFALCEYTAYTSSRRRFINYSVEQWINPILESNYFAASFSNAQLARKFSVFFNK
jgi:hypothetical protein